MQSSFSKYSDKSLPVAFLGGGLNSAVGRVHRIAIELDHRFRLVAGCFSREEDENVDTASDYDISENRVYGNIESLLKNEVGQVAAIVILTPTPSHHKDILKCLRAGLPVISEKALCGTAAEALELQKVVEETKGFLAVTYNYSGYPMLRELKDMIESGRLGTIHQIVAEMPQEGFMRVAQDGSPAKPQKWRLDDLSLPTVSLDLGVHLHQLVHFLTGARPVETVAVEDSCGKFSSVIDNVSSLTRYSENILCNMWFSKVSLGKRNGFKVQVFGSEGAAEWIQLEPENLHFWDNKGTAELLDRGGNVNVASQQRYTRFKAGHPSGFIEAFANLYVDLADAVSAHHKSEIISDETKKYVFGAKLAAQGLSYLEAIKSSAVEKKWIQISRDNYL